MFVQAPGLRIKSLAEIRQEKGLPQPPTSSSSMSRPGSTTTSLSARFAQVKRNVETQPESSVEVLPSRRIVARDEGMFMVAHTGTS